MSLQICHCGWSKKTSYQGLRTHQGKMGCTPKGVNIPESEQFRYDTWLSQVTDMRPPIKGPEPPRSIFPPLLESDGQLLNVFKEPQQMNNGPINCNAPVKKEPLQRIFGSQAVKEANRSLQETQQYFLPTPTNSDATHSAFGLFSFEQPLQTTFGSQANPAAAGVAAKEANRSFQETQQHFLQMATNNFSQVKTDFGQPVMSQIIITQMNPEAAEVAMKKTNRSLFETPPRDSTAQLTGTNARRALDFQPVAQVGQQLWHLPTTAAQETPAVQPKESKKDKEQKAWQDKIRANLQQKIQTRQQKIAEVKSSVKACKCDLDAEWVEINDVFSEAMRVMEDARQKALRPLEARRQRVKRDTQDLVQTLQKEIDKLKKSIDELDKNPDLQAPPLTGPGETCDVAVDTSLSFGSLRATTSNMMQRIHQELEQLSSVELRRMPKFAVDVKLDPTTAHPYLVLSPDGKTVGDGGTNQRVRDAPQRFDMFGSILGLNRLTSGRSYWEVEVSNKTGWDLGVARRGANRKGKLALNPSGGYWVAVHYQGEKYAALAEPPVSLALPERPRRVGVFVDYEEGLVSFYDVTAHSHIYSFTECSFGGEILPYFSPHLKENDKNFQPLIISAVAKQQW